MHKILLIHANKEKESADMKKIECTFYRPDHVDIREFSDIVNKLESDLTIVCSDDVSEDEIRTYAEALLPSPDH